MTVPIQDPIASYVANGVTAGPFTVPFRILVNDDLKVLFNGDIADPSTYVFAGLGDDEGSVTFFTLPPAGTSIIVYRQVALERENDYQFNGDLRAVTVNADFDRIWMALQDIGGSQTRTLRFPVDEYARDGTLPEASARFGKLLGFDDLGGITMVPIPTSVGAGDLHDELGSDGTPGFKPGVDFTVGVSTSLQLSRAYGTKANLFVAFDASTQGANTFGLNGQTLTFDGPLPAATVFVKGGTTLSIYVPPNDSVGDDQLTYGATLVRTVASVSAMQNLNITKYQRASTNAYYAGGQGGAEYYYDPAYPQASANGFTAIVSNTGAGCWRMVPRAAVTLFQAGAKGDDVADDTAAVQAAAAWSDATGVTITVPAVTAAYRTTAPITGVSPRFIGDGCVMTMGGGGNVNPRGNGSWFHFDHTGRGFSCNAASVQAGYPVFEKIGTIRNQPTPNGAAAFTPTANDFDFYLWNCDASLRNFVTLNPTKGVFVSASPLASQSRTTIDGWRGQPLQIGINVDFSADIVRTKNVHLWPYWSTAQGVFNYMLANAAAYLSGRNDNPILEDFFAIYYGYGISIYQTAQGTTSKMAGVNVDIDGSGVAWLYAAAGVAGFSAKFTNCDAQGVTSSTSLYGIYLDTASNGCSVSLVNCAMGVYMDSCIHNLGVNNVVKMASTALFSWNGSNGGFPAVSLGANSILQYDAATCDFTAPVNAAANFSVAGIVKGGNTWSLYSGTTDGAGNVTVPHNFGHVPTGAMASGANASTGLTVQFISATAAAVVFNVRNASSNAAIANTAVSFPYNVFF